MVVYVVQHGNMQVEFSDNTVATTYAQDNSCANPTQRKKVEPDLRASHISLGLSSDDSDAVFDALPDVLLLLKTGDYSGAKTLVDSKEAAGVLTEPVLTSWSAIIDDHI